MRLLQEKAQLPVFGTGNYCFDFRLIFGAGEAIRTPDPDLGKVVLYP